MNMQTFNAMRSGAKAMQDARGRLDVDQVDDVMDDIKDEMDIAEQVMYSHPFELFLHATSFPGLSVLEGVRGSNLF